MARSRRPRTAKELAARQAPSRRERGYPQPRHLLRHYAAPRPRGPPGVSGCLTLLLIRLWDGSDYDYDFFLLHSSARTTSSDAIKNGNCNYDCKPRSSPQQLSCGMNRERRDQRTTFLNPFSILPPRRSELRRRKARASSLQKGTQLIMSGVGKERDRGRSELHSCFHVVNCPFYDNRMV